MIRTTCSYLSLLFLLVATMLTVPSTLSAAPPPPGPRVKVFRPAPASRAGNSSPAVEKKSTSLFQERISRVLVHPEPKRWINGRCVLLAPQFVLPRR